MTQPGSIFHNMPPRGTDYARALRDLERQVRMQGSAQSGQAMQVGAGGIVVTDGGSITIEGTGALNVGAGVLNAAGAITTTQSMTAGGAVESGNGAAGMDAAGNIDGTSLTVTGAVTGDNGVFSGQVQSNGLPVQSLPSHSYQVATNYVACWINGDGTFGTSQSSVLVKTALQAMTVADAQKILNLTPYWGRYVWDDTTVPLRVFFLAQDVANAGFGPDVAPVVTGQPLTLTQPDGSPIVDGTGTPCVLQPGDAYTVNYSQLVVPLLNVVKTQQAQISALQAQVQQLATAADITLV